MTLLRSRVAAWGLALERIGAEITAARQRHGDHPDTNTLDVWATGLRGIVSEIEKSDAGRYLDAL